MAEIEYESGYVPGDFGDYYFVEIQSEKYSNCYTVFVMEGKRTFLFGRKVLKEQTFNHDDYPHPAKAITQLIREIEKSTRTLHRFKTWDKKLLKERQRNSMGQFVGEQPSEPNDDTVKYSFTYTSFDGDEQEIEMDTGMTKEEYQEKYGDLDK